MGKKKIPKNFTVSLLIIICSLFAIVAISFAVMFISPGTEILGFQYISYSEPMNKTYTTSTEISVLNIRAVKIVTDCSAISVKAGQNDSQVYVNYNRKIYGIVRSENSDIVFDERVTSNQSFEEDETLSTYRTLVIDITEPSGFISTSDSVINVFLPSNIAFEVVYLSSEKGNVNYNSTAGEKNISAKNLYLMSSGGDISINNTQTCDNYFLKTTNGKVNFNSSLISAKKVKFKSENGSLNLTNSAANATLTLTEGLIINSTANASVSINILNGDLDITAKSGIFAFDTIGSQSSQKNVSIHSSYSTFKFGTIYADLNVLGNENVSNNTLNIKKFVNSNENNNSINSGTGNVVIEELDANIMSVSSTSGNIHLQKVSTTTSIYSYSSSGAITISYIESSSCVPGTTVKVFSKTGNISLSNISGFFEVEVLENSSFSRLDIVLSAVCYETGNENVNIVYGKNRKVNLTLKGYQNDLICRILSQQSIQFVDSSTTQVNETDYDYILGYYTDYDYEYRVGYAQPTNNVGTIYEGKGKVFINGTGNVVISFQID